MTYPKIGYLVWVNWVDYLPEQFELEDIDLEGQFAYINYHGKTRGVPLTRISTERPHVSLDDFEHWWNHGVGTTHECFDWLAYNTNKVSLEGVTCPDDLVKAIKEARYKFLTGRSYIEDVNSAN